MPNEDPLAIDVDDVTRRIDLESGTYPVVDHGDGPAVLLLHGFPDSRHLWRYQVPALADAGFRVVAHDQRGFGDAPKPEATSAYEIVNAREDAEAILDALGIDECAVVGHDWGAEVAWHLATQTPDRVERLALLGVGPGDARHVEAWEQSWYFWFFQYEGTAEAWLRHDDWQLFREWLREEGDFDRYLEDLSRPGALTAALDWYRANVEPELPGESDGETPTADCPVVGLWSDGDHHLAEEQMTGAEALVEGSWRYERIADASHWMMLDRPARINELLLDFLVD